MKPQERRILLLYSSRDRTPFREHVSLQQLTAMARALRASSWEPCIAKYTAYTIDRTFRDYRPELVFNLAYGYFDPEAAVYESQPEVTARLEAYGVECVGASARAQRIAQDKLGCAALLSRESIASPQLLSLEQSSRLPKIAVLKPRFGACHRGVRR